MSGIAIQSELAAATCRNICLGVGTSGHSKSLYEKGLKNCANCYRFTRLKTYALASAVGRVPDTLTARTKTDAWFAIEE